MFEGILFFIILVLGVPFFIGYIIGKNSSGNKAHHTTNVNNQTERILGQYELRDFLVAWLKDKPETIKKSDLFKKMGLSAGTADEPLFTATTRQPQPAQTAASESVVITQVEEPAVPQKTKEERDLQNINTILYVASFLLVAAAVLFIGAAVDNSLKFIGAWVVTVGFYGTGMLLHLKSTRLRPAAIAFVGTGLALLPFAGLATDIFVLHNPSLSWFITSMLGLTLFLFATLRLQNQVLAYLTLGFVFSLTTSSVAVLQIGFVWYFVLVILAASMLNVIAFFKPKLLPPVFLKPIDDSGQLAVPLAVFGSWIAVAQVPLWQNALVLAAAALHYGVAALAPTKINYRGIYIFLARLAASLSAILFAYDWSHKDWVITGVVISAVATIQIVISSVIVKKQASSYETLWLWSGLVVQLLVISLWTGSDNRASLTTASLMLGFITSISVALWLKKSRYALVAIVVGMVLPLQVGKDLFEPNWSNELIAAIYIGAGTALATIRQLWFRSGTKVQLAIVAYGLYLTIAAIMSLGFSSMGWSASYLGVIAVVLMAISYIEKSIPVQVIANSVFLVAVYIAVGLLDIDFIQRIHITTWIAATVFYVLRVYFPAVKDQGRAQVMGVSSVLLLLFVGLMTIFSDQTVAAALTLIAASALLVFEARVYKQHEYYEIAALVTTLAFQRLVAINNEIDILLYVNWWGIIFYALAWWRRQRGEVRATQFWFIASVAILAFFALTKLLDDATALSASLTLFMVAAIFAVEGWVTKKHLYYEIGVGVVTVATQRIVSLNGDYDSLLYTHWWALTIAALAGFRFSLPDRPIAKNLLVVALCVLSIPTGLAALDDPDRYQFIFLIEHVILLVIGGLFNYRLVVLWGASGVGLAVLYWLRDQTYILLSLLGIGLIALAVWRLLRKK